MEKQSLLNTYVNSVDMAETIAAIEQMIADGKKSYIVAINVDVVMKIEEDPYLKKIVDVRYGPCRWKTIDMDFQTAQTRG